MILSDLNIILLGFVTHSCLGRVKHLVLGVGSGIILGLDSRDFWSPKNRAYLHLYWRSFVG